MDWEAEAYRIVRAFGVDESCRFVDSWEQDIQPASNRSLHRAVYLKNTEPRPFLDGGYILRVDYSKDLKYFGIDGLDKCWCAIYNTGDLYRTSDFLGHAPILAPALFHLDLLTPEVEKALNVNISAHQKLEWALAHATLVGQS